MHPRIARRPRRPKTPDALVLATVLVLAILAALVPVSARETSPPPRPVAASVAPSAATPPGETVDWLRNARVGGLGLHETASDDEIDERLARLVAQGVSVLEADSSLSDYLDEADWKAEMDFIRRVVEKAHQKGLKVVWYYPSMEVITPEGRTARRTMKREHPDWVQRNFDRKSFNFFYGTLAFWVEPNDESAWMCPNSPYRAFFYERMASLAATGLDGIWLDVPLFNSIVGKWPCADPHCVQKFQQETGMKFPTRVDFGDERFRKWVAWRHKTIADFLKGAHEAGRSANPSLRTVVEVVSCDHMINTLEGLDATWFDPGLDIVWEVDAISDTTSMMHAGPDDWLTLMAVYKYCQGASDRRSRWAFTYGFRDDDAQLVMACALAAQCNPYETRIPQMVTTVGHGYRTRMFRWIADNVDALFGSQSGAPVALLYSDATRDYVDGTRPGGFYVTPAPPSPAIRWWVLSPDLSVLATKYLAEYRGWAMALISSHVPFDIVTANQSTSSTLQRYRAVVVPAADCLSDAQRQTLADYASQGGTVIVTGPTAGSMDEHGNRRRESAWAQWRGKSGGGEQPSEAAVGQGRIVFWGGRPGMAWLKSHDRAARTRMLEQLRKRGVEPFVAGEAPVYVQAYEKDGQALMHLVHYGWVGRQPLKATTTKVRVDVPWSGTVTRVTASEPGEASRTVAHAVKDGRLSFEVPVRINVLVRVEGTK